jgi:plasmid stability protein
MELPMPDLSIKDVPVKELEIIRSQAKRNHRSLQGELRAIISDAARRTRQPLSLEDALEKIKKIPLKTSSEAVRMVREDRDGR